LPRLLEKQQPAIVLIELGGNDGLRGLPVEETRKNLSAMIEQSQAVGARVILAEMRIPPNYGQTYTEKFRATYTLLTEKYEIILLPFLLADVALEPGMMQPDGIHPSIEAQPVLLDKIWPLLEPELL
jgi:acyl-CoA thioesterase-1